MNKQFTKDGAKRLHAKFDYLLQQFAKDNGVEFDRSHLTYGSELSFTAKFSIKENKEEAWNNMKEYFKSCKVNMYEGQPFIFNGKKYVLTGKLNSGKSKFKIEATLIATMKNAYFTIDSLLEILGGGRK